MIIFTLLSDLNNKEIVENLLIVEDKISLLLLFTIFEKSVPDNLQNKCKWLSEMDKKKQSLIFGLKEVKRARYFAGSEFQKLKGPARAAAATKRAKEIAEIKPYILDIPPQKIN